MTQVGVVGQIVLLLRERLERGERGRARASARSAERPATPQQRIEALAAIDDLPSRDFRRALVRSLLSAQLGDALVVDPAFDAVTGEVLRIIEDSEDGMALLEAAIADVRAG